MPETYLAVAAAQWILLVRSSAVAEAVDGGVEGHDLAALFGGAVAAAWIRLDGGVATLGVSRVLGLVDLAPDDFALMPEGLAPSSMFDAVTLAPIESFAVPAVEPYSPPLEEGVSRVDAVGALFDPNAGVPVDRPLPPPSSAMRYGCGSIASASCWASPAPWVTPRAAGDCLRPVDPKHCPGQTLEYGYSRGNPWRLRMPFVSPSLATSPHSATAMTIGR